MKPGISDESEVTSCCGLKTNRFDKVIITSFFVSLIALVITVATFELILPRVEQKRVESFISARHDSILGILETVSGAHALAQDGSAQNRAMTWLVRDAAPVPDSDVSRLVQRYTLAVLFYSCGGADWTQHFDFLTPLHECNWNLMDDMGVSYGVICENDRVVDVKLVNNNVTGSIPSEISQLASLERLYLQKNFITGEIPQSLVTMEKLNILWLFKNHITGSIPSGIGDGLVEMVSLDLSSNRISGSIPASITRLPNLVYISLFNNRIGGRIPSDIGRLKGKLRFLEISSNELMGHIPDSVGHLVELRRLFLNNNLLTGEIPQTFAGLTNAELIALHGNRISGDVSFLCDMTIEIGIDCDEVSCSCPLRCQCM